MPRNYERRPPTRAETIEHLNDAVRDAVCWQYGADHAWDCDALIGAADLEALADACADLPMRRIRQLIHQLEGR
jgi:hypothetical protein